MRPTLPSAAFAVVIGCLCCACANADDEPGDPEELSGDCLSQCSQQYDECTVDCDDDDDAESCQTECDLELPACNASCEDDFADDFPEPAFPEPTPEENQPALAPT